MRQQQIALNITLTFALCALVAAEPAAQNRSRAPQIGAGFGHSLPPTGLNVRFAENTPCTPISSPYGSPTRYDGSPRRVGGGPGSTHGGIDLTLAQDTPLLAVAAGTVFASGSGGMMEGHYLWLLHLPERSGMPFAFLSKYQHLSVLPVLPIGQAVKVGQEVARSGSTGTVGGHYGAAGYAHLHLTVRVIQLDKIASATNQDSFLISRDTVQADPLILYIPGLRAPDEAQHSASTGTQVLVSYVDIKGSVQPASALTVWPVACG